MKICNNCGTRNWDVHTYKGKRVCSSCGAVLPVYEFTQQADGIRLDDGNFITPPYQLHRRLK